MQIKDARVLRANHDAHCSTLTSRVYMRALNVHFIFCAHAGFFMCIFRNVLSRVVAARVSKLN